MKIIANYDDCADIECDCGNIINLLPDGEIDVCDKCGKKYHMFTTIEEVK